MAGNLFGIVQGSPWRIVNVAASLLYRHALERPITEIFEHYHRILFALHHLDSET